MEKIITEKIGMTRIFDKDGKSVAVTLLAIKKEDCEKLNLEKPVRLFGISKGKGFSGVIKRHGFSRGPETHGSDHHRHPGSIGSGFPERVFPGKKMPGRMGNQKTTLKKRPIIAIEAEKNIIAIKGSVPGPNKTKITIEIGD